MPLAQGLMLHNRYRIVKLLGEGGFGAVYRAWDMTLNNACAIKENFDVSPQAAQQFVFEAQTLAKLSHPNLPRVIDHFVIPTQGQYLVMDFIEGEDLQQLLERANAPLPQAQALKWIDQICDALGYLHFQNIIHRDIKPANIKVTPQGKAMLIDLGIAKLYAPSSKTATAARAATEGYSPPEQYGQGTDARSDVYALGATLYTLLAVQTPPNSVDMMMGKVPPLPLAHTVNRQVSESVARVIAKAMMLNPDLRFQTMADFKMALTLAPTKVTPPPAPTTVVPSRSSASSTSQAFAVFGVIAVAIALLFSAFIFLPRFFATPTPAPFPTLAPKPTQPPATSTQLPATSTQLPPTPTPAPTLGIGSTRASEKDGMVQVYVPAGAFSMGSDTGGGDEKPVHTVTLNAYWIDKTEVTNAMFTKFVQATGYKTGAEKAGKAYVYTGNGNWQEVNGAQWRSPHGPSSNITGLDLHPVAQMSWNDAQAYCSWAGRRLPTEAEWEKAARGDKDKRWYPWGGDKPNGSLLNFADKNFDASWADKTTDDGYKFTAPVGSYPKGASPYGALDMAGNVWEWVNDWYDGNYYGNSPAQNPTGPTSGQYRALRGGAWGYSDYVARASNRYWVDPSLSLDYFGFRCVSSP